MPLQFFLVLSMTGSPDRPTQESTPLISPVWISRKANDPAADERKCSEDLRNELMMGVLKNAQAAEIHCLSQGREGDA
jgi:hypothetical protein